MSETFTTADLIAELQALYPPIKDRPPGYGITAKEWQESQNLKYVRQANEQLEKMRQDGVLDRDKMRCEDGRARWVYYKTAPTSGVVRLIPNDLD